MAIANIDWIKHHASYVGDRTAMIDLASGRKWNYREYHDRVAHVAGMLKELGVEKGDRVAFLALNSSDIMDLIFGCWRIGAVCLALNFRLAPGEFKFILNNAEAKVVLLDDTFKAVEGALEGQTTVEHWISTDCTGGDNEFESRIKAATPIYDMVDQDLEDQCMLMYSSGTTGQPKGVIITHSMLYFAAAGGTRESAISPTNVALCNMPLFHIGGLNVTALPAFWIGGTAVIMRMFTPEAALDIINDPDVGVTSLFMVPAAYNALRAHPKAETTDFSRITAACAGAETVPTELVQWYYDRGIIIQEGYGMTETAAVGCFLSKSDIPHMIGSAGRAMMHSTIRIVDPAGNTCAPNVPGEIWIKGATVTPGYWRNPEANAKSFQDGWLKSGDIGRMNEKGYIYIEDRIKDMYISGGENVYPAEVENCLYQMDQIAEVAVIGVPHDKWGEVGCACAVLKPGTELTIDEVRDHCDGNIAKYKWPMELKLLDALPRTASGKVQKFELRKG